MTSVNICLFTGNIGKKPEIRHTKNGNPVMSISLCVTDRRKNGEVWEDKPNWLTLIVRGKRTEYFSYLDKGMRITAHCRVSTRSYEHANGQTIHVTEFECEKIEGPKNEKQAQERQAVVPHGEPLKPSFSEDDIPF